MLGSGEPEVRKRVNRVRWHMQCVGKPKERSVKGTRPSKPAMEHCESSGTLLR